MPNANRQHAAEAIEIFVALLVPNLFALAFDDGDRLLVIHRHGREEEFLMLAHRICNGRALLLLLHKCSL